LVVEHLRKTFGQMREGRVGQEGHYVLVVQIQKLMARLTRSNELLMRSK
jgi:hypothetical protein